MLKLKVKQVIYEYICAKEIDNIKSSKPQDNQLRILKKLSILSENSAEGIRSRRQRCWGYVVSVFENTSTNVVVQRRAKLEHSSYMVKAGVEAT